MGRNTVPMAARIRWGKECSLERDLMREAMLMISWNRLNVSGGVYVIVYRENLWLTWVNLFVSSQNFLRSFKSPACIASQRIFVNPLAASHPDPHRRETSLSFSAIGGWMLCIEADFASLSICGSMLIAAFVAAWNFWYNAPS